MSASEEYYSNYGEISVDEYVERHIRSSSTEMTRINDTISLLPAGISSVLDVGAGHGILLEQLQHLRAIAGVGIEISDSKIAYGRAHGVDMRHGDAASLSFSDRSFDAIISCEVIEHLPWGTYEAALSEIARIARSWILISVPNNETRVFARCPYCGATTNPSYHLRSFSPTALKGLFAGFELDKSIFVGVENKSLLRRFLPPRTAYWHELLICPSCSYRMTHVRSKSSSMASPPSWKQGARRLAARMIPRVSRSRWIIALYRRI